MFTIWPYVPPPINSKRHTALDGHLSTMALRLICQRVSFLHLRFILDSKPYQSKTSLADTPTSVNFIFQKHLFINGVGGWEAARVRKKSRIIYPSSKAQQL